MANRRLQSLLEANKQGLTLRYDPSALRNLCFYRCLSKFVDVKEEDIVQMVQRHLFYMHVWQFTRNANPGYQDFAAG